MNIIESGEKAVFRGRWGYDINIKEIFKVGKVFQV
jgi:hypothetical protein